MPLNTPTASGSFEHIALAAIRPSSTNPRKHFDQAALAELAESIRAIGVTNPILLRPEWDAADGDPTDSFEIVTGERRFRAAQLAGLTEIPAIVRELDDAAAAELQLVENLQRQDLHPIEEAEGYRALLAPGTLSLADVARVTGKAVAHVARTLRLLALELPIKTLFHAGHLSLGHALLLARLTPADQDKAVRNLLNVNHLPKSEDMQARVVREIADRVKLNTPYRMVRQTEAELREWINHSVLLQLAKAPWSLDDADLVPEAGACTTCPKRSGSDAALFADITAEADMCLDAACFATKQKAFVQVTQRAAEKAGKPLLKLSAKNGHQPLPSAWVAGEVPAKTKVLQGQWLEAKPKSCASVIEGVLIDEPSRYDSLKRKAGDVMTVCADQSCKVHKHTVDRPKIMAAGAGKSASGKQVAESYEERQKREKAEHKVRVDREQLIRAQVVIDVRRVGTTFPNDVLRYAVALLLTTEGLYQDTGRTVVKQVLKLPVKIRDSWQGNEDANEALAKHIAGCAPGDLPGIALEMLIADAMVIQDWHDLDDRDLKESRQALWDLARALKVDADKLAREAAADLDAAAGLAKLAAAKEEKATEKKKHEVRSKAAKKGAATKKATKTGKTVKRWNAAKTRALRDRLGLPTDHKSLAAGDGGAA